MFVTMKAPAHRISIFYPLLCAVLFLGLHNASYAQLPWTADFENTAAHNAWTTTGAAAGANSLAANDCYNGGTTNIYYMIRTNSNACAGGTYSGTSAYYNALSGNGSAGMYTQFKSGGNEYLFADWQLTNTSLTAGLVSPIITNTNANVQLYFTYTLGTLGTCSVWYSTNGGTTYTQIGGNLIASSTLNTFSSTFSPGGVNFILQFLYTSAAVAPSGSGAFFEFDDVNLTVAPCVVPTAQPTALTFPTIMSTSIAGSFTAASPVADGYLVVRTTTSTAPTNPVNGTNYTAGSSALGGVIISSGSSITTFTATGLTQATQYWFWIYSMSDKCLGPSYYTTSPLSGTATTKSGKNWNGAGVAGGTGGTNFTTAANWLPTTVPGATDEAIITTTTAAIITLTTSATVGALTILNNDATNSFTLALDVQTGILTVLGDLTANVSAAGGASNDLSLRVGNSPANFIIGGNAYLGTNANTASYLEFTGSGSASSTGFITFKGNTAFGNTYYPVSTTNVVGAFIWDGTGTQIISANSPWITQMNGDCQIGSANTPSVVVTDPALQILVAGHNLTVNAGATLDLTTNGWNHRVAGGGGSFTNNGTLRLGAASGGQAGSNFPKNYAVAVVLAATSTVEYYNTTAQTIYAVPTYGNLTVTNNATRTPSAALTVAGNLTINTTATFAASTFTHNLQGNFINNGTFTASTGTVNFNGTLLQTISGSTTTTFYKFTLANAAGLTLSTPANVSNILTLTTGPLFLNSQKLTITNAATAAVTRTAGYVVSETNLAINPSILQWNIGVTVGAHVFPFGTSAGGYIPVTINNAGNVGNISISTRPTAASDNLPWAGVSDVAAVSNMNDAAGTDIGTYGVIDRWWDITSSVASPIPAVTLSLSYMGTENTIFNSGDVLGIQHWNGAVWDNGNNGGNSTFISTAAVGSTAGGPHTVTGTSTFTYFSPYVLIGISAPLPIELLSFTATPNKTKVDIKWTTQSETNNKNFTVERSSDAQKFTEVTTLNSKAPNGNSILKLDYQTTDASPLNGTSYYRLKQTDYNGEFKYFNVVPVVFENNNITFTILPNPNQGQFKVDFTGIENNHEVQILMHDVHGKLVYSNSFYAQESLNSVTIIPEQKIGKGVYFCSFIAEGIKYTVKVVVE